MFTQNILFHNGTSPSVATQKMELNVNGITLTDTSNPITNSCNLSLTDLNMDSLLPLEGTTSLIQTLTNIQGPTGGFVTINTDQTINGVKTFTSVIQGTATNANNVNITSTNNTGTYFLPFVSNTGYTGMSIDNTTTPLTYNPSTSTLNASVINSADISGNRASLIPGTGLVIASPTQTLTTNTLGFFNGTNSLLFTDLYAGVEKTKAIKFATSTPTTLSVEDKIEVKDPTAIGAYTSIKSSIIKLEDTIGRTTEVNSVGLTAMDGDFSNNISASTIYISNNITGAFSQLSLNGVDIYDGTNTGSLTATNWTGNASSASSISLTSDNTSGTYYLPFSKTTASTGNALFIDNTTTPLTYSPSTSTLTATTFSGNASSASSISLTSDDTSGTYYLPFSKTIASNSTLYVDNSTTPLTYNPSTSTLTSSQLTLNTPTAISTTATPYGLYINSAGIKTYPTTANFASYPAYYSNIELGTSQTISTQGPKNVYGDYRNYTKSGGNTTDINALFFNGFSQSFNWTDLNTCRNYTGFQDNFYYNGINANARTSSSFNSNNIVLLTCPASSAQTISAITAREGLYISATNATTTTTITGSVSPLLNINGTAAAAVITITNHSFFENNLNFGVNVSGAGSSVTITNLYGLRLQPPFASTGLAITNNWGIYSGWSLAKNYFAGGVGIGTTTGTNALDVVGTVTASQITNTSGYFYGLSKDAYPALNPYSSGVKAVSTWTTRTSAADNDWRSVCWSAELGIFVAISQTGIGNRVMTSPDGITWTIRTSAADNIWFSVCWSAELGIFVAVSQTGTGNRVMTSPDGITWTIRTSAADNDWKSVCWSAELGIFVAVSQTGTGNRVMTSPNGTTWTIRSSAADNSWNSVCWSAELGIFVAVSFTGTGNRVMTSPDGITWTIRSSSADNNWFAVCWSAELGIFVAVSTTGTGNRVMTSPNGTTWTTRGSAADNIWTTVCWSAELGIFVAVSNNGTGNRVMTSPNGTTWTTRTSAADNSWQSVCWSPELGIFVVVSQSGTGNRVMTSSLLGRPPTSYNVFNSSFNRIDETGNWIFNNVTIRTTGTLTVPNISTSGNMTLTANNQVNISGASLVMEQSKSIITERITEISNRGIEFYVPYNSTNPNVTFGNGLSAPFGNLIINSNSAVMRPSVNKGYDIGSSSFYFNKGYVDNVITKAIGLLAGQTNQGANSVAFGSNAGQTNQGANSVALGVSAGQTTQSANSVAIGNSAGNSLQQSNAVAIGLQAGLGNQQTGAIAIGYNAGNSFQQPNSIAIGTSAGQGGQGANSIAIGNSAGVTSQGANSIAIGNLASSTSQTAGSICLNASGLSTNANQVGCFIRPIRSGVAGATFIPALPANVIYYDTTTFELLITT